MDRVVTKTGVARVVDKARGCAGDLWISVRRDPTEMGGWERQGRPTDIMRGLPVIIWICRSATGSVPVNPIGDPDT
jgi:hypothetical protein